MDLLHLIGRIIFGGFFIYNGMNHFMNMDAMKAYAGSKGTPAPALMVPVSGLLLLVGGASVLLGLWPEVGLWLLIIFLVPTAFIMHNYWAVPEDQKQTEQVQFTKDLALAGAALMMLLFTGGAWPFSLGG